MPSDEKKKRSLAAQIGFGSAGRETAKAKSDSEEERKKRKKAIEASRKKGEGEFGRLFGG